MIPLLGPWLRDPARRDRFVRHLASDGTTERADMHPWQDGWMANLYDVGETWKPTRMEAGAALDAWIARLNQKEAASMVGAGI